MNDTTETPTLSPDELVALAELRAAKAAASTEVQIKTEAVTPNVIIDVDEKGNVQAEVLPDKKDEPAPWAHGTVEFGGETLQVRKPSSQALIAFSIASGGIEPEVQMKIFRLFLQKHLSPQSFGEVLYKMMDPDTTEEWSLGGLLKAMVMMPEPGAESTPV